MPATDYESDLAALLEAEFGDADGDAVEAVAERAATYVSDTDSERPPEKWLDLVEQADGDDLIERWNEVVEYVTMHFGPDPEEYTL